MHSLKCAACAYLYKTYYILISNNAGSGPNGF